ncbi:MAG: hypothetical protein HUJ86_07130, partial [Synergistes sp.]|nr:hypothetical protein [Synergistes sp.]
MKKNGNNEVIGDYYLGLDVGTNSVGWAVTDRDYNVLKAKGKALWGVNLFEEAQTAAERRTARVNRRRLARRKQRLNWLEDLFAEEIAKKDPDFFHRLHASDLLPEDKSEELRKYKYLLFNDTGFNDTDYSKRWPSIYHLRRDLVHSDEEFDVRLVFLALRHILRNRGHFYAEIVDGSHEKPLSEILDEFLLFLYEEFDTEINFESREQFEKILTDRELGTDDKKRQLNALVKQRDKEEKSNISAAEAVNLLAGSKVKLSKLFCDDELKE